IALCVARLSPEKNQVGLVRAFRSVADRMPDARLALAGDGPARAEVEAAIDAVRLQDRVLVLGNRSDVPVLLAAGDALVLASEREGLPLVVMEAMAAGRPVVATAVGDVPLAVRNGETGFVAPPGDEAALADALSAVLADPQCASELGRRGREIAEAEFDIRRMVAEHEGAYGGPRSG
ncbi:MAG: glycosyltransferase, partial [Acidithiobacillus sp.]|uniref:glycosyltransferase n=1 Tax=Acidithiobacillus sp. TaxID=1872118 RepID=UPI002590E460